MIDVSDDRWTCPRCGMTAVVSHDTYRAFRLSAIRMVRDTHLCPKAPMPRG